MGYFIKAYELGILCRLENAKTREKAEEIAKKLKLQFQKVEIIKVVRNDNNIWTRMGRNSSNWKWKKAVEYINDLGYNYSNNPNDERSLKIYDLGDDIIEMLKFYNLYIHKNVEVNSVLELRFTYEEDRTLI